MSKELSRRDFLKTTGTAIALTVLPDISSLAQTEFQFEETPTLNLDFSDPNLDWQSYLDLSNSENSEIPTWNDEDQAYTNTPDTLYVKDGNLVIQAHTVTDPFVYPNGPNKKEYDIVSAEVKIFEKISEQPYGKLEIIAKMPKGVGTWPALWMLPANGMVIGQEPVTSNQNDPYYWEQDGEIDFAELLGVDPGVINFDPHTYNSLKSGAYPNAGSFEFENKDDPYDNFHDYGLEWYPDRLNFLVDGEVKHTIPKPEDATAADWPFDKPFYLILNVAMGGGWNGEEVDAQGLRDKFPDGIDYSQEENWKMKISRIQYFRLKN